jgi:hypothetical protein
MDAYIFQAALLCEDCARATERRLLTQGYQVQAEEDSDRYPCGPFCDGGGEADSPQHCDTCQVFLQNPLTQDGVEYVQDKVDVGLGSCIEEWSDFYNIHPSSETEED